MVIACSMGDTVSGVLSGWESRLAASYPEIWGFAGHWIRKRTCPFVIRMGHWKFIHSATGPPHQPLMTLATAFRGWPRVHMVLVVTLSAWTLLLVPHRIDNENQVVPFKQHHAVLSNESKGLGHSSPQNTFFLLKG